GGDPDIFRRRFHQFENRGVKKQIATVTMAGIEDVVWGMGAVAVDITKCVAPIESNAFIALQNK
ncbi:hypothetical protein, partial [Enterobacter asburiae]|uniref:hypothetical protein n=1 Tax=Enterobacter asburiae TaxID=61645 RepID=UPI003D701447